jgi:hypothetical protein
MTQVQTIDFVQRVVAQILTQKIPYVRLHSCGEFYSQEYFDKWCQIAKCCKTTKFLAFTRNYDLNLTQAPTNFIVFYSIDDATKKINPTTKHLSHVVKTHEEVKHMQKHKDGFFCASKCHTCRACWNVGDKKIDIVFKQH